MCVYSYINFLLSIVLTVFHKFDIFIQFNVFFFSHFQFPLWHRNFFRSIIYLPNVWKLFCCLTFVSSLISLCPKNILYNFNSCKFGEICFIIQNLVCFHTCGNLKWMFCFRSEGILWVSVTICWLMVLSCMWLIVQLFYCEKSAEVSSSPVFLCSPRNFCFIYFSTLFYTYTIRVAMSFW